MVRHARTVLLLMTLASASVTTRSQQPSNPDDVGLSGAVIAPDGTPVTSGTIYIAPGNPFIGSSPNRATATIDRTGHFRVIPATAGVHELVVSAPGLATHRVHVTVPVSKTMKLPAMQLSLPTFFRARFVTADGEPILSPQIRRESLDASGARIVEPPDVRIADQIDGEGTITIGPLPRGVTTMALDMPLFAQMRLPDLYVTGAEPLLDGGTIVVQPGATLHVDLVDASGAPVASQNVFVADALPLSPIGAKSARTNQKGRATFERMSSGRYRISTGALHYCNGVQPMMLTRLVALSGAGTQRTRIVIDGTARFRLSSVFGPLRAARVLIAPDSPAQSQPQWLRADSLRIGRFGPPFAIGGACGGFTDGEGRITITNFPPGPTRVEVRQLNSTFVRRVTVADDGRELPIAIPDGFFPVRVLDTSKNAAIASADVSWIGGGGRVDARTNALGEALLEGVGATGGTLVLTANGFDPGEEKFAEVPAMLHEVALAPSPPPRIELRVVNAAGRPVRDAVVELAAANAVEIGHIAATDAKGGVTFTNLPGGVLRFTATADGHRSATVHIAEDKRSPAVLTLAARQ